MSQGPESPAVVEAVAVPEADDLAAAGPETDDTIAAAPPRRGGGPWLWARVALAVALLGASATGRAWQARRVDQKLRDGRVAPFTLGDLPETLGYWVGEPEVMDPAIARATGSTDSIFRSYQHRITGQRVSVIVLFGPSVEMYVHSPDNCYRAAGYQKIGRTKTRTVTSGPSSWPFYETVYAKGEGGKSDQQEVYCTWRYSEAWTPALTTQKGFQRIPGMFKVQVGRHVLERELDLLDDGNPSESFLAQLMPELDRRIAEGRARSGPAAVAGR